MKPVGRIAEEKLGDVKRTGRFTAAMANSEAQSRAIDTSSVLSASKQWEIWHRQSNSSWRVKCGDGKKDHRGKCKSGKGNFRVWVCRKRWQGFCSLKLNGGSWVSARQRSSDNHRGVTLLLSTVSPHRPLGPNFLFITYRPKLLVSKVWQRHQMELH